jgi:hypothetical protein
MYLQAPAPLTLLHPMRRRHSTPKSSRKNDPILSFVVFCNTEAQTIFGNCQTIFGNWQSALSGTETSIHSEPLPNFVTGICHFLPTYMKASQKYSKRGFPANVKEPSHILNERYITQKS